MDTYSFKRSYEMFEEAEKLVPGGIYGPRTPRFLTYGSYPCFFARGEGSHVWDVDGNEFIDYMCSFGTNILGQCHSEVDEAAIAQMRKGNCFTLPTDTWNPLARKMVGLIDDMDWVAFGKNGSDVTSYAAALARCHTGRNKIVILDGAYNGSHFWCSPMPMGIPEEYRAHVLRFEFNNIEQLRGLFESEANDVAAVMVTPHHHPTMADQVMPSESFYTELVKLCHDKGALVVIDDIRCGFRLDIRGSHRYYGAEPDLVCFGKAVANGYPISMLMGKEALRSPASSVFFTGTHFFAAVPMAAAMKTLDIIERDGIIPKIRQLGEKLASGMKSLAKDAGLAVHYTGHPAIPYMRFDKDDGFSLNRLFCGEACKRGVFLHPHHNWFLSGAHTDDDIDKTLEVAKECFAIVAKEG